MSLVLKEYRGDIPEHQQPPNCRIYPEQVNGQQLVDSDDEEVDNDFSFTLLMDPPFGEEKLFDAVTFCINDPHVCLLLSSASQVANNNLHTTALSFLSWCEKKGWQGNRTEVNEILRASCRPDVWWCR